MNFLSHYYLGRHIEDPHFTLGMVLPDLARNHNKQLRFKDLPFDVQWSEHLVYLHKGVKMHHLADHLFHNSEFFKNKSQELKLLLQSLPFKVMTKHQYFMAHIAVELLLDRLLLRKYPLIYEDFYRLLLATNAEVIAEYFRVSGFEAYTKDFVEYFGLFNQNKYIQHYIKTDSLSFALGRIYRLSTGVDITPDKNVMSDFIEKGEQIIFPESAAIFAGLKDKISETIDGL